MCKTIILKKNVSNYIYLYKNSLITNKKEKVVMNAPWIQTSDRRKKNKFQPFLSTIKQDAGTSTRKHQRTGQPKNL